MHFTVSQAASPQFAKKFRAGKDNPEFEGDLLAYIMCQDLTP
jgi:hypothetical protein